MARVSIVSPSFGSEHIGEKPLCSSIQAEASTWLCADRAALGACVTQLTIMCT